MLLKKIMQFKYYKNKAIIPNKDNKKMPLS